MAAQTQKRRQEKLLDFLRGEFRAEEQSVFARLSRVPDSLVMARLNHYNLCTQAEKDAFADCCAHFAYLSHSHLVEAPAIDHTKHPYFRRWCNICTPLLDDENLRSVPLFRAMVQQYKIDKYRGTPNSVTEEQFARASSVRSVKAPSFVAAFAPP